MDDAKKMFVELLQRKAKEDEMVQAKRAALMPHFATEEEALAYARRIAALRPGDMVKVIGKDDDVLVSGIFVTTDHDGDPLVFLYDADTKALCTARICWHGLVLD